MHRSRVFGRFCIAHDEASGQNELDENPWDDNPRPVRLQNILKSSETKEIILYQIRQVARKEASVRSVKTLMNGVGEAIAEIRVTSINNESNR